ncbi:MAG TPA: hypothetical protein VF177_21375 [Anaerolineae bacterium]
MTPTLFGRWQTRLLLLGTVGSVVTFLVIFLLNTDNTPWVILVYVIGIGFFWDILYNYLQGFRWDRDWSPVHQLLAGIVEGVFVWLLATFVGLPGVTPGADFTTIFVIHYTAVWITTFLASQGLLRIIFPRWRYRGGQWIGRS